MTLEEAIALAMESRLVDVHVSFPARVTRYDSAKQVADVLPVVHATAGRKPQVITNVPIAWYRGGTFFLTMPLAVGDWVHVVVNDQAIERWRSSNAGTYEQAPDDPRQHHTNSVFAYPVAAPTSATLPAHATNAVFGKAGGKQLHITPGGQILFGSGAATDGVARESLVEAELARVKADLDALKTALAAHIHTSAAPGSPTTPPVPPGDFSAWVPSNAGNVGSTVVKVE